MANKKIIINVADSGIDYRKSSDVGSHLVDVNLCGIAESRGNTCTVDLARTLIRKYIAQWEKTDPKSKCSDAVDLERLKLQSLCEYCVTHLINLFDKSR